MDFNWNDIYQDFYECKAQKCSEREFQRSIYTLFRYYLRWQNNIIAEENIPIGSVNTIRPDFVLYKDDVPQIVIESKEPNHFQNERNKEQLFSYMRQKKVDFGLYIGEMIQLYYDVPTDVELPLLVFTMQYNVNESFGDDFVKLFNYIDFSKENLTDYCTKRLDEMKQQKRLQAETRYLLSAEGNELCHMLLQSHLTTKGYSDSEAETILADVEIILKSKHVPQKYESTETYHAVSAPILRKEYEPSKRRQKYSVNGRGAYYKNGSALELVKAFTTDHPSTYHSIVSTFNSYVPNMVLSKQEVDAKKERSYDRSKTKRWHEDSPLISSDGITFYVTTQVGDNCPIDFKDIVALADKLGYKIEPIS